jgi:phenylacetate-CoA ligase
MAGPLSKPDRSGQFASLQTLLATISQTNPFYAGKLRRAGYIASLDEFFDRMPFTSKQELIEDQRANPPLGSNLTYPIERYTRLWQTSSTSGQPLYWMDTPESMRWMLDNWARVYQAAGVTAEDRIFFAFSFGLFLGFWTAFESAERLGAMRVPGGGMSSAARLRAMLDIGATVLCCTPTYALRLAEVAAHERIDLTRSQVRRIIVAGEPGGSIPGVRFSIEEAWPGASVVDHHGMTETGPVSYGCPVRPGVLHVIESAYIAEVLDPNSSRSAPAGVAGELVLTTLGRAGSPLLRYRTGDLVQQAASSATEPRPSGSGSKKHTFSNSAIPAAPCGTGIPACLPCSCGTYDLALAGGILGRTDDMVVVRGVNVYPGAVEDILRAVGGVAEYRVEIDANRSLSELRIQIEPSPDCADPAALSVRLQVAFHTALGLRISVSSVAPGALPRFEMKARRWVRLPS